MAKSKFLDLVGLSRFKDKIVSLFTSHTSDNNIHTSSEEKNKLSKAYTHSTSTHAPTDAEKNIIVGVQKNGSDISVNSSTRKVNITVPTKVSELDNDTGYLTAETSDTKVKNTLDTTTKAYVTGTTSSTTNTGSQIFDTNVYLDTTEGQLVATTFKGSLEGNATSASKVYGTLTNPTSDTSYYITFHSGASTGNKSLLNNNGLRYSTREGTTDSNGLSDLILGNNTEEGTIGNKYARLFLYGTGKYYTRLSSGTPTANRTILLPDNSGTITLTSDLDSYLPLEGGTVTGTLVLSKTTDISGTADNSPALIIGGVSSKPHLELDGNEIAAKSDGVTPSILFLNMDGGLVQIGSGGLKVSGTITGTLSGNAETATKWSTARNINGMSVQGDANRFNYGTCSTEAATADKVVSCSGFSLATGSEITVKFTVTNTASSPTLNVNSTGAKAIYYRGSAISAGVLAADRTYTFRYNGTQYDLVGDINTNTTNTTGSTNTSSKIYLVGATSQASAPQTYSHDTVYVGTDGCIYSNSKRVINEVIASSAPSGLLSGDYWILEY